MAKKREADVVVLGCGAGGISAALSAKRKGASVLIIERQRPEKHTPSLRMSGGWMMTLTSATEGTKYLSACAGGIVDEYLLAPWAERAVTIEKWLADIGVTLKLANTSNWGLSDAWAEHPHLPGAKSVRVSRFATTIPAPFASQGGMTGDTGEVIGGEAIYRGMMKALADNEIEVQWDTEASSLIFDQVDGQPKVKGVTVIGSDKAPQEIHARHGVIIATGGFGASREYIRRFLPVPNTRFYGNPGNDGAGLRMAMSVGADLVRMTRMVGRGVMSFTMPDGQDLGFLFVMSGGGYVICDQAGQRYVNEYEQAAQLHSLYYHMLEFNIERVAYSRSPSYWIFDERRRQSGPLPFTDRGTCAVGLYDWSKDNQREIQSGWISKGDTPGAAAVAAGAENGAAFDASVAAYNAGCKSGKDAMGRPQSSLVPLDSPPYYCVPLYVGGPYSHGGPLRDLQGRVIATNGKPIPGLYSSGELGQAIGMLYPASGASICETLCLGALAGEAASQGH